MTDWFHWTETTKECYELKADCSRCSVPKLNLNTSQYTFGDDKHVTALTHPHHCHAYMAVDRLLEKYGPPVSTSPLSEIQQKVLSLIQPEGSFIHQIYPLTDRKRESIQNILISLFKSGYVERVYCKEFYVRQDGKNGVKRKALWFRKVAQ